MTPNLKRAEKALQDGATCAAVLPDGRLLTSQQQGVRPLLDWLREDPYQLKGASVADRVTGRASAFLMVFGGVKEVYTKLVSVPALAVFADFSVPLSFDKKVPNILNRTQSDICPMEKKCLSVEKPEEAFRLLCEAVPAFSESK